MKDIFDREIKWPQRVFITGIDTDAGKTYVTGTIAMTIAEEGESVITQKFIQTGNKGFSEDIEVHRSIMGIPSQPADLIGLTAPVILSYPASADLAAKIDGVEIDTDLITKATDTLAEKYSHVLIEGAGGLMVPIKDDFLAIDYVKRHKLPVVVVTNSKLGSINHTLLTLHAIASYHIDLFAVVFNPFFDKDKLIAADTVSYLARWTKKHFPDTYYLVMP